MEYTIYNESLVYYALRDKNTGKYVCSGRNTVVYFGGIKDAQMFQSMEGAQLAIPSIRNTFKEPPELQIRKVKVIDIGELNENI